MNKGIGQYIRKQVSDLFPFNIFRIITTEVIMKNTIIYDGIQFHQRPDTKYYRSSKYGLLHRYIWEKEKGPIPDNYIIHHKDCNPGNNNIDNLQMISWGEHSSLHHSGLKRSEETKYKISKALIGITRDDDFKKAVSNRMKGRKVPLKTRIKMREAKLGIKLTKEHAMAVGKAHWKKVLCVETGKIYMSVKEAVEETGIVHISTAARGERNKAGGYHWRYL